MDRYFEMRLKDYLIHIYARYGANEDSNKDIVEEFNQRNAQFAQRIMYLLEEIGIPHPGFGSHQGSQFVSMSSI